MKTQKPAYTSTPLKVLFLAFFHFAFSGYLMAGVDIVSSTESELRIKVSIPAVTFTQLKLLDGNVYKIINAPPAGETDVGSPQIPVFGNWILIPNGKNLVLSVEKGEPIVFTNISLPPVLPYENDITVLQSQQITRNEAIYSKDADFPGYFAFADPVKFNRGQPCTILWIYPYQYNPVKKILTVYPDLEVTVQFTGVSVAVPGNFCHPASDQLMKAIALNGEQVINTRTLHFDAGAKEANKGCEMLIITHPDFLDAAETLALWKNRKGMSTRIWDTTTTDPFVIKDYINDVVANWNPVPYYLLFVGDAGFIPCWHVNNHYDIADHPNQGRVGSDFYYADNEYQSTTGSDYVPDFSYGRLSVDAQAQADSLVNRIIRYEKSPPSNDWYYYTAIAASYFQDDNNDSIADRRFVKTAEDVKHYFETHTPFRVVNRIYTTNSSWPKYWSDSTRYKMGDDTLKGEIPNSLKRPLFSWNGNKNDIKAKVNDGRFLLIHRDHGSRNGWDHPVFRSSDVDGLLNGEKRPIVWSINCQTGWFDNETDDNASNTGNADECFAEHWIRHSTGGSCGMFAATRISSSVLNNYLVWGLMDGIFPDFIEKNGGSYGNAQPVYKLGDILNYGKNYLTSRYGNSTDANTIQIYRNEIEMYHCFGDPAMEMWTDEPATISSLDATDAVVAGAEKVSVAVTAGEPEDFLVSVYSEDKKRILGTGFTDNTGVVTIPLDTCVVLNENLLLTATKHNYIPKDKTITVGAGESGFITADKTWTEDTIKVVGNITVEKDVTLTIEEGVFVLFKGHFHINIYGRLLAEGTKDDSIIFSPENKTTGWHGLRFFDTGVNAQSSSKLKYCKLEYGKAEYQIYTHNGNGGAVFCQNSSELTIEHCLIAHNQANAGGGIFLTNSDITIEHTVIRQNSAVIGGGLYCYGGSDPTVYDVEISENSVTQKGGGLMCYLKSAPEVKKVVIENNYCGQDGGGIHLEGYLNDWPEPVLDSVTIRNNESAGWGGGMFCSNRAWPKISHSTITGNAAGKYGGGVACNYAWPELTNVTISYNDADSTGGGVYVYNSSSPDLKNCILWDDSPNEIIKAVNGGTPTVSYSDIEGGHTGTGNLSLDPQFYATTGDSAWYITVSSPCLDAGDPYSPHDPDGSTADMGAFYYHQSPAIIFPPTANFEADTTYGYFPLTISFTDLSQKGSGVIKKWNWDFGDLTIDTLPNPVHTFTSGGNYTVSLVVKDENNLSDTIIRTNYITAVAAPPVADFSADTTEWYKPFTVDFTDESTAGSSAIETWNWDFGDLTSSTEQNPSHTYSSVGSYTVRLSVTDVNDSTDTREKSDFITILPGTYIRGGFVSGTWTTDGSPYVIGGDITVHSDSSLSLNPGVEVLFLGHHKFVINGQLSAQGTSSDSIVFTAKTAWQGWHGLRFVNSPNSVLSWCKIEFGRADGVETVQDSCGGGVYCYNSPIEISHCLIKKNVALKHGGGLFCDISNVQISNCRVEQNSASENGGGIYSHNSGLTATADTLVGNEASSGGGIFTEGDPFPTFNASLIHGNKAYSAGGGVFCSQFGNFSLQQSDITENTASSAGGGVYLGNFATPSFLNVSIEGNHCSSNGGGLYFGGTSYPLLSNVLIANNSAGQGGGIFFNGYTDPGFTLTGLLITENSATCGGGIYYNASPGPRLNSVTVDGNQTSGEYAFGGGIYFNQSSPGLFDVLVRFNTAFSYEIASGGGMYLYNGSNPIISGSRIHHNSSTGRMFSMGGGITCDLNSNPTIYKTPVYGNIVSCQNNPPHGGGLYCTGGSAPFMEKVTLSGNDATTGAGGAVFSNGNGTNPTTINSVLWDNLPQEIGLKSGGTFTSTYSDIKGLWPGIGNINSDPLFENPVAFDYHLTWPNYPVLAAKSPCIDAGNPASPPDPDGTIPDMGAYFFDQTSIPPGFDFGDCPDVGYPVLLSENGAQHLIDATIFLGNSVDADDDGQPQNQAMGDDDDGNDDDDGVIFQGDFVPGSGFSAIVTASTGGYLNAWCDWNADGDWNDASEQIFSNQPMVAGANNLTIHVPATAALDTTFCRFRFNTSGGLGYDGGASDGEVEDYQVIINSETYTNFAIWHFDENQGNVVYDETSNHNNGTAFYTTWTPGIYGSALSFNGSSSYVTVPHATSLDITAPFSVQAWLKCSGTAGYYAIVDKYTYFSTGSKGFAVYLNSGKLRLSIYAGSAGNGDIMGTTDLRDNQSHHVFASWDGSLMRLFVDGKHQASAAWTHAPVSTTAALGIGKRLSGWGGTMIFSGIIDEVKISDNPFPDRDFGDAPDPGYPTLITHNGAFHLIKPGVCLGNTVDPETDGLPDVEAKGDNHSGYDDEDGVKFTSAIIPGHFACLEVTASAGGKLSGWMDFDHDGDWADAGETIFSNEILTAGTNSLSFEVPVDAIPGITFSRFRFSTFNINGFEGFSPDGEVEDYRVEIAGELTQWQEGFEDYTENTNIVGQGDWEMWGGISSSPTAKINAENSYSGENSLKILGNASMSGDDIIHQFNGCNSGIWEFSTWQFIPGNASGGKTYFILLNEYDCVGDNVNWSLQLEFDPDLNLVKSDFEGVTTALKKNLWVKIMVLVDLENNLQSVYYDGNLLVTKSWTEGVSGGGDLNLTAVDLFSGTLSNAYVFYDDLSLNPVNTQVVDANEGWSGISSCLDLVNPEIETIMQPVVDDLEIIYNFGGVYWPGQNLNTLGEWNRNSGYVMKLNSDATMVFCGYEIADKTLCLNAGWNLIPVFLDAEAASTLGNMPGFLVAKGVATTEILWPAYNINTLTNLATGKAYFVYTTQPGTLTFSKGTGVYPDFKPTKLTENPWNVILPTPQTHLAAIALESLKIFNIGDWIGAFTESGLCAGASQITATSKPFAITLFGDDPTTPACDGFVENEPIHFKTWNQTAGKSYDLRVSWNKQLNSTGSFANNGLSVISSVEKTGSGSGVSLCETLTINPNPSRGLFALSGISGEVSLSVFDAFGRQIRSENLILPAETDLTAFPKGVYFMNLKTGDTEFFEKLIIE